MKNNSKTSISEIPLSGLIPHGMTNDYMFRALLQKNITALTYLIACLLNIPVDTILSVTILNQIVLGEALDDKSCILDLYIRLNNNRNLNLEMQVKNYHDWPERSLYYLSRTYASLRKGQSYNEVLPTIHIGILNFSLFPEDISFYSEYLMQNTKTHHIYSDKFAIRVLDLTQIETDGIKEEYPELYYWAKFFVAKTWEEIHMLSEKSKGLHEAVLTLKELSEDEKIQLQCEAREMYDHTLASAKRSGKIEVAINMLDAQLPIEQIIQYTGLTESEIRSLK